MSREVALFAALHPTAVGNGVSDAGSIDRSGGGRAVNLIGWWMRLSFVRSEPGANSVIARSRSRSMSRTAAAELVQHPTSRWHAVHREDGSLGEAFGEAVSGELVVVGGVSDPRKEAFPREGRSSAPGGQPGPVRTAARYRQPRATCSESSTSPAVSVADPCRRKAEFAVAVCGMGLSHHWTPIARNARRRHSFSTSRSAILLATSRGTGLAASRR